jgi:hypothetical protein
MGEEPTDIGARGATKGGGITGTAPQIGRTYTIIYTYEVTVTRYWYNRTTYHQNQEPTYSQFYEDKETERRLVNISDKIYD